jgi:hypothetical protein
MPWLSDAQKRTISELCGVPQTHPLFGDGVACAESLIPAFTGVAFGSSAATTLRVTAQAKTMQLELPRDVSAVTAVTFQGKSLEAVFGTGYTTALENGLMLIDADDQPAAWLPGAYRITCTQGFADVPGDVLKAASLVLAWFVALSDPERSRYTNFSLGDFSADMRLLDFPVPEARQLLDWYRTAVRGAL